MRFVHRVNTSVYGLLTFLAPFKSIHPGLYRFITPFGSNYTVWFLA